MVLIISVSSVFGTMVQCSSLPSSLVFARGSVASAVA
uniref:Uncharacterized protein n=1 Tax=Arundo donax TaxID=35708 RepID=A0A0A9CCZ1_ARUDO